MKQTILSTMIAVLVILTATTGVKAQKGFYAGVQGGRQVSVMFNQTDLDKPGGDYTTRGSYNFGVSGGYNLTDNYGIGTEVNYSFLRQRYTENTSSYTQKFKYLRIPVLFTVNTDPSNKFMFTAKAGPQLGLLLSSDVYGATNPALNGSTKDEYKKITYGAMAGIGARMRVTNKIAIDGGLHFDGTFGNSETKKHHSYQAGRTKTRNFNGGFEVGVKYFL